jgi:hypothetical protein
MRLSEADVEAGWGAKGLEVKLCLFVG